MDLNQINKYHTRNTRYKCSLYPLYTRVSKNKTPRVQMCDRRRANSMRIVCTAHKNVTKHNKIAYDVVQQVWVSLEYVTGIHDGCNDGNFLVISVQCLWVFVFLNLKFQHYQIVIIVIMKEFYDFHTRTALYFWSWP